MQHLGTEATRSAMSTQHKELSVRSDREPSILAVVDGLKKSCRNLGITAHDEGAPVKDHHSIGAAEVTVQVFEVKSKSFDATDRRQSCRWTSGFWMQPSTLLLGPHSFRLVR